MPTIGVSLAVPDPCGAELQDYRIELGDDSGRLIPTHITLVPPYDVDEDDLPEVVAHLRAASAQREPFRVTLRGTGTFRPTSPVVFVNVVEGISQCEQLADALCTGPLDVSTQFPYHPHVTVAHQVDEPLLDRAFEELASFHCQFDAVDFHLYAHDEESGWQVTDTFVLAGSPKS